MEAAEEAEDAGQRASLSAREKRGLTRRRLQPRKAA